jgi:uncharacterized membrane protein
LENVDVSNLPEINMEVKSVRIAALYQLSALMLLAIAPAGAQKTTITTFDPPGAVHGTYPVAINDCGDIAGYYEDANYGFHGFVRDRRGSITTLDVPQATATLATSINAEGEIVGTYQYMSSGGIVSQSLLRSIDGTFTTLVLPNGTPVYAAAINAAGEVTGDFTDSQGGIHGYLRHRNGSFDIFDAGPYTRATSINQEGDITGYVTEPQNVDYGFLRSAGGNIVSFAVPGAAFFFPYTINDLGQTTGVFSYPANLFLFHSFVRDGDGITTFDPPGATTSDARSINITGTVTGWFGDSAGETHGFLRFRDGAFSAFDGPGSTLTEAWAINSEGDVTGFYVDSTGLQHGFVRAND